MAERVPSPPPPPISANQTHKQIQLPNFTPGTYVVQVPKDQIYRVPAPENARIAELHRTPPRNNGNRKRRCCCCCCFVFLFVLLAVAIFVGGLVGGLFSTLHKAKGPRFSIQRFQLIKQAQYNMTLQVSNPNSKVGILYNEGGNVSLSMKQQEIASGTYPTFYQGHDSSTVVGIALRGSKSELPKAVQESMKNDKNQVHVTFSLTINVPTRMKMGALHSGTVHFDVTCQVTVDTLAKPTRILSQQCQTKRL